MLIPAHFDSRCHQVYTADESQKIFPIAAKTSRIRTLIRSAKVNE